MTHHDTFAHYLLFIRTLLSAARIRHSIGVMQVMADLASVYSLDRAQAVTAGLLHDAPLSRCLRIADVLAPMRLWPGIDKLEHVTYAGRLEEASLLHAAWVIEYFTEQGIPIHPNLSAAHDALATKLAVPASFFDRE